MTAENLNTSRLERNGRTIVIIGTAHVSEKSAEQVEQVIAEEKPDTVCVELCLSRYRWLMESEEAPDSKLSLAGAPRTIMLPYLLLWYFQKRIGKKLRVQPGRDMLRAIEAARAQGAYLCLADRDFRTTLERAWHEMDFKARLRLFAEMAASLRAVESISTEEVEKMKQGQGLEKLMDEFSKSQPELKRVFIEERDEYMAHEILSSGGSRIVAVVGAAHAAGILYHLNRAGFTSPDRSVPPA